MENLRSVTARRSAGATGALWPIALPQPKPALGRSTWDHPRGSLEVQAQRQICLPGVGRPPRGPRGPCSRWSPAAPPPDLLQSRISHTLGGASLAPASPGLASGALLSSRSSCFSRLSVLWAAILPPESPPAIPVHRPLAVSQPGGPRWGPVPGTGRGSRSPPSFVCTPHATATHREGVQEPEGSSPQQGGANTPFSFIPIPPNTYHPCPCCWGGRWERETPNPALE